MMSKYFGAAYVLGAIAMSFVAGVVALYAVQHPDVFRANMFMAILALGLLLFGSVVSIIGFYRQHVLRNTN